MNKLLLSKDNRYNEINNLLLSHQSVISIKANIPGKHKNIKEAYILCRVFFNVLKAKLNLITYNFNDNFDEPYVLIGINEINVGSVKKLLISTEEDHALGRFIDLDLYHKNIIINRSDLGYTPRKCYFCSERAHICAKNQTHPISELLSFIRLSVRTFIIDDISNQIDLSIMKELNLEDKFGLVTKTSTGSHDDMNYTLMIDAKQAILPYMIDIFKLAYDHPTHINLLDKARQIGIQAEQKMLIQTKGVNAYKGLIFVLGFMLIGIGRDLSKKSITNNIFEDIKKLSQPLNNDFKNHHDTFGLMAYQRYGIKGARGEIMQGFPTLQILLKKFSTSSLESDVYYRELLKSIIIHAEDTVLLKRSTTIENYYMHKKEIAAVDVYNIEAVKAYTSYCINHHLSFGGSADLLITFLLLKHFITSYVI